MAKSDALVTEEADLSVPMEEDQPAPTASAADEAEAVQVEAEEEVYPLQEGACLFCTVKSDTFENTLTHMAVQHSFFVPDIEYVVDIRALLAYLQEKVFEFHVCLRCNGVGRGFQSTEAARKHMVDKGHCMLDYSEQGQEELCDFFDFRPSYPDYVPGEDNDEDLEDEEWEDISGDEEDADEEEVSPEAMAAGIADGTISVRRRRRVTPMSGPELQYRPATLEIVLPGGRVAGHRSLQRYYKQHFSPQERRESVLIQRVVSQYAGSSFLLL